MRHCAGLGNTMSLPRVTCNCNVDDKVERVWGAALSNKILVCWCLRSVFMIISNVVGCNV